MDRLRDGQAQGRMGMEEQGGAGRSREEQGVRGGDDGRGAQAEGIPLTRTRRLISLIF